MEIILRENKSDTFFYQNKPANFFENKSVTFA